MILKRVCDFIAALVLIILLSPVILGVAIAIALTMGRPVVFRQRRPGLGERMFDIIKFRTMTDKRNPDGTLAPDAERLTRFGSFLRKTSLDELPELFGVLRGDMSLVGPRPLLERYLPYYTDRERLRHTVRPGITGWAQVHGRNEASWSKRLECDAWYVEHWSLWLDLRILLMTIATVFKRQGVVVDPHSIMLNLDEERGAPVGGNCG